MHKVPKQDWHIVEDVAGISARQITHRFRKNQWELKKRRFDNTVVLTDEEFNLFREGFLEVSFLTGKRYRGMGV